MKAVFKACQQMDFRKALYTFLFYNIVTMDKYKGKEKLIVTFRRRLFFFFNVVLSFHTIASLLSPAQKKLNIGSTSTIQFNATQ